MYFITRAFKYLRKKIGKTILLGIIFLIIANFVLAGLLIRQASINAQDQTRLSIGADITYIPNWDEVIIDIEKGLIDRNELANIKRGGPMISEVLTEAGAPTYSNILKVIDSEYVEDYHVTMTIDSTIDSLEQYQLEQGLSGNDFNIVFHEGSVPDQFANGTAKIVDGRMLIEEDYEQGTNVIVISQEVANQNRTKIGDLLDVTYPEVDGQPYSIQQEVVGIYTTVEEASQTNIQNATSLPQNRIYTPFKVLEQVGYEGQINDLMINNNTIRLTDPEMLEAYRTEMNNSISIKYGLLDANDDLYESLVGPIEVVGLISNFAVTTILITGGVIIGLITALTVNERKGEIGILLAVGESKVKIVSQFVIEVLVIAVLTFGLSMFTGGIIGDQLSNSALSSELIQTEEAEPSFARGKGGFNKKQPDVEAASMDLGLSPDVIASLFAMGIALSVISTIIPALYVMRFNPKQILSNRNS